MRPSAPWYAATSLALAGWVAACSPWFGLAPVVLDKDPKVPGAFRSVPTLVTGPSWTDMGVGSGTNCVFGAPGLVSCWGQNFYGELGSGDTRLGSATVVPVVGGHSFRAIAPSDGFLTTCGLRTDSVAYCWGANTVGQLGIGTADNGHHATPGPVSGNPKFASIAVGGGYACAIDAAGAGSCWGGGLGGVLGSGADSNQLLPRPVTGGLTFTALSAGPFHSCGIASGAAYCWGSGDNGQLGVGTPPDNCSGNPCARSPTLVAGGFTWRAITTGQGHSCAITTGLVAYCWGRGLVVGQIGVGKDTSTTTPLIVAGELFWSQVTAGREHTCGLTVDGFAYCWGTNDAGQLGLGSTSRNYSNAPLPVAGNRVFVALDAGGDQTCGLTTQGNVYCWGVILR